MTTSRAVSWQRAVVVESIPLTQAIRRIVLRPEVPHPASAGAHIDVKMQISQRVDTRSYSVVDSDPEGKALAISVLATATSRGGAAVMHALAPGESIEITRPIVDFPLRIGAPRYVLLAGGIGITAIAEMAAVLKRIEADYTLVYLGPSRSQLAYLDVLEATHGPRLVAHISDEGSGLDVADLVSSLDDRAELYVCGPIRLMDAVRRTWVTRELPLANLRFETFGNSGWFDAEPFTVRVPRLGIETIVSPSQSLLEALEAAGADMMFDCRKGECGLCEVRILSLCGDIDHRDVFYSDRQRAARSKMCCCVSRVVSHGSGRGMVSIELT